MQRVRSLNPSYNIITLPSGIYHKKKDVTSHCHKNRETKTKQRGEGGGGDQSGDKGDDAKVTPPVCVKKGAVVWRIENGDLQAAVEWTKPGLQCKAEQTKPKP